MVTFLAGLFLKVLKLFCKPDDRLILFNSFGGKKYDDSPKAIYEKMLRDKRFAGYRLVWAFDHPGSFPEVKNKIKNDGLKYFITALKARCWVSNSSIQRGIDFKGKNTFSLNTWHGTPLKKMGADISGNYDNRIINNCDVILAQGDFEINIFSKAWNIPKNRFALTGYPRNDALCFVDEEKRAAVRNKLGIPADKKAILYAPTFRDYNLNELRQVMMRFPLDCPYWEVNLEDDWVFILRAHYEVSKQVHLPENSFWVDHSGYESLDDLMIASDILITDYSSIMFDYSLLGKPILGFVYDYDEYAEKRGMYFDVRDEITCFYEDHALVDYLACIDYEKEKMKSTAFCDKYIGEKGHAAEKAADIIYKAINS